MGNISIYFQSDKNVEYTELALEQYLFSYTKVELRVR